MSAGAGAPGAADSGAGDDGEQSSGPPIVAVVAGDGPDGAGR
ncbi:hypothetical protein [Micromonospora sp. C95]|nr:hypothetical protein [Micromonospora sp. C95]